MTSIQRHEDRPQSRLFEAITRELLRSGNGIRFQARGASMSPAIRDGEIVHVKSVAPAELRKGDIVLVKGEMGFRLHRLVVADAEQDVFITRGDCGQQDDPAVSAGRDCGHCGGQRGAGGAKDCTREAERARRASAAAARRVDNVCLMKRLSGVLASSSRLRKDARVSSIILGLLVVFAATLGSAQVAVDATTSGLATMTGAGSHNSHLYSHDQAGANRLLIVGVSINITNAPTTGVVGVTYNGTPLSFVGAHNDAGDTRRVEMWYLLSPAHGTNLQHCSDREHSHGGSSEGVVAGATTFTGVDQTVPLGTFVSADGAAAACSSVLATGCGAVDVPSVVNGMILDTLAIAGNQTVTVPGPQVSQWTNRSGGNRQPWSEGRGR